jgi:streptogramin lyase
MSTNGTNGHKPHALLRAGFPYLRTMGMRRVTTFAMDIAFGDEGRYYILCRHDFQDLVNIRILNWEDEDLGTVDGTGRGAATLVMPVAMIVGPDRLIYVSDEGSHKISALRQEGGLERQWGTHGTGPGDLNRPSGFAFDAEGTMWVADTLNHRVQRFTTEGKYLGGFGEHGSTPGKLDMPWGIAIDADGNLLVVDWRNDRVQRFTPAGELLQSFGESGDGSGQFNRPAGICVDGHGDIYVADRGNNRVLQFAPDGRYVDRFLGDATMSRIGRRYILANPKTLRLREMARLEVTRPFRTPPSVRVDHEFRMFVADTGGHRIQVYQKDFDVLTREEIFDPYKSPMLQTT